MKKIFKNIAIVLLMPIIVGIMLICMIVLFLQNVFISKKVMAQNKNFGQDD